MYDVLVPATVCLLLCVIHILIVGLTNPARFVWTVCTL